MAIGAVEATLMPAAGLADHLFGLVNHKTAARASRTVRWLHAANLVCTEKGEFFIFWNFLKFLGFFWILEEF